tara:strand:- start:1575 stop:2135 length:561 start_codon:yes stop_codon:yes gene_type:complete
MNIFDSLRSTRSAQQSAVNWFTRNVKRLSKISPAQLWQNRDNLVNNTQIGKMYMFYYDAKTKNELPYWDKFPLVIPIEPYSDGFLGMNFHYLKPKYRQTLLTQLLTLASDKNLGESTKIRATYNLLNSGRKYKWFKPTIKRYLSKHVRSRFLMVDAKDWEMAILLPVERFQKASAKKVWEDSRSNV